MHPMRPARIGVDIGRVIIAPGDLAGADTSFLDGDLASALGAPPNDGAFAALAELARAFEGRVWLVSKAGPKVQDRTRRWLAHHRFAALTGVPEANVRFCRERRDKAEHARALALSHFVDDRADVLRHLEGIVPHRFLFGPQRAGTAVPRGVVAVLTWAEALAAIRPTAGRLG